MCSCGHVLAAALALPSLPVGAAAQPHRAEFRTTGIEVVEATIAELHAAIREGRLSARQLVEAYLARIEAYDRNGPALNSILLVNPEALSEADTLDDHYRRTGRFVGPLHGIPIIVKDNYDTRGLQTTAGSLSLLGSVPAEDAFQVRRLREAGAIILAKSNMAEFAFSPYETVGSVVPGPTRNPYAPDRTTAGSSGGTAAAVAASFGAVGLGTDTGNSIRGPAAHTALVGIRPTMGLTSRAGVVPLYRDRDVGGPMARTVEDAVRVLDVIAGPDPADPVTLESRERIPARGYLAHLRRDGLVAKRIGALRSFADPESMEPEVLERFEAALADLRRAGAILVDPVEIPEYDEIARGPLWYPRFRWDIDAYLAGLGSASPVPDLEAIVASGKYLPDIEDQLRAFLAVDGPPDGDDAWRAVVENAERLRQAVRRTLFELELDAIVYPTWTHPPRRIGDLESPQGNNSPLLAPPTGFPAVTVPMGWVRGDSLPVGLQILGDAWSEATLIEIAFAYEQATGHRRPPPMTPPLVERPTSR